MESCLCRILEEIIVDRCVTECDSDRASMSQVNVLKRLLKTTVLAESKEQSNS